jgi:predicted O-methyltransferase YrrM
MAASISAATTHLDREELEALARVRQHGKVLEIGKYSGVEVHSGGVVLLPYAL